MGIPMGVPYFQIKDIMKKAHVTAFSSHFALYRDISARVFAVVKKLLPSKEQYSIDEAFFTFEADTPAAAESELRRIKREVERLVGIPVSIGLAATKTQAKYANRLAKKAGGVVVLTPEVWLEKVATIALGDIWGVGRQMVVRYRAAGMECVADLLAASQSRIDSLFGIAGLRLQAELAGREQYGVAVNNSTQKSIMSSRSFKNAATEIAIVKDAVAYHVRHAASELRTFGLCAQSISVSIRPSHHGDFLMRGGSQFALLPMPTADTATLLKVAFAQVEQLFEPGVPYKKAGVVLGQFVAAHMVQPSLFTEVTQTVSTGKLMETIDAVNAKFGRDMLQIGRQIATATWVSKQADLSPAYTTNWDTLAVVKT
jgi:DNA polymerase V